MGTPNVGGDRTWAGWGSRQSAAGRSTALEDWMANIDVQDGVRGEVRAPWGGVSRIAYMAAAALQH